MGPEGALVGRGQNARLTRGALETLAVRAKEFFRNAGDGSLPLIGLVPFDRDSADYIWQPAIWEKCEEIGAAPRRTGARVPDAGWSVAPLPEVALFKAAVSRCAEVLRAGTVEGLRKVVLSRCLDIEASGDIDAYALFHALSEDKTVTAFTASLPEGDQGKRTLVGATPELLVSLKDGQVVSHPLAGSSRRFADSAEDRASGERLLASRKDSVEHNAVVEAVMDGLAPFCASLSAPEGTNLRATDAMWHLGTRIVGTLKSRGTHVAELVEALHPTPAVCGLPREAAMREIRDLETHDRGFYAGAIGWMDSRGEGRWFVTLRCAELCGARARLYAGAGIVAESDPASEADETSAKFVTMLSALGIDEAGAWLRERAA